MRIHCWATIFSVLLSISCLTCWCLEDRTSTKTQSTRNFLEFSTLLESREIFPDVHVPVIVAVALPQYSWASLQQSLLKLLPAKVTVILFKCPNPIQLSKQRPLSWAKAASDLPGIDVRSSIFGPLAKPRQGSASGSLADRDNPFGMDWEATPKHYLSKKEVRLGARSSQVENGPPSSTVHSAILKSRQRRLGEVPAMSEENPGTSHNITHTCLTSASTFTSKVDSLLLSHAKVNFLVYASRAAPALMSSLALMAAQRHSHIQRVAVAVEKENRVNYVTVIDTSTEQRLEFQRSALNTVFQNIYDRQVWTSAGLGSGPGSTVEYTQPLREQLAQLLLNLTIKTMVDAPCGGMLWMPRLLEVVGASTTDFRYYGLDVSCGVISSVKERFANQTNWSFACMDISEETFPVQSPDLVFSRDALQHLPYRVIHNFLRNVKNHKAKYLLVGSYLNSTHNTNIYPGGYFMVNLLLPPFNLRPKPLYIFMEQKSMDNRTDPQKYMLLIDVAKMEWDNPVKSMPPPPMQDGFM